MPFLLPNQQCQSTEGNSNKNNNNNNNNNKTEICKVHKLVENAF